MAAPRFPRGAAVRSALGDRFLGLLDQIGADALAPALVHRAGRVDEGLALVVGAARGIGAGIGYGLAWGRTSLNMEELLRLLKAW